MKKIYALFLISVLSTSCAQAQKQNDWTKMNLKGRVKTLKTTARYQSEKEGVTSKWLQSPSAYFVFDKNGYALEKQDYKEDGSLFYTTAYTLNADSQLIQSLVTMADGRPGGKTTYTYDGRGNMIEEINYKPDGTIANSTSNTYDVGGNKIETTLIINAENQKGGTTYQEYDARGNIVKSRMRVSGIKEEDAWSFTHHTYDDKGNCIERSYGVDGLVTYTDTYTYDDKGNETGVVYGGSTFMFYRQISRNYEYDTLNNWIKKYSSADGKAPAWIEERVIEYY